MMTMMMHVVITSLVFVHVTSASTEMFLHQRPGINIKLTYYRELTVDLF